MPVRNGPRPRQRWKNVNTVTVAQGERAALRTGKRGGRRGRRIPRSQALGVLEKGKVQRPHMVAVQAVERKHFPIRPHAVLLRAGNNAPTFLRLVQNEIDVFLGVSEIRYESLDVAIKAH